MPDDGSAARRSTAAGWAKRLGWLVGFWAAGVIGLALVAFALRLVMRWAGFSA